jgi:hypothetical protein
VEICRPLLEAVSHPAKQGGVPARLFRDPRERQIALCYVVAIGCAYAVRFFLNRTA